MTALLFAGCAAQVEGDDFVEEDVAVSEEALTAASFTMPDAYYGTSSSGSSCSSSYKMDIAGNEPAEAGRYPVAVFVTGTGGVWNNAGAMATTAKLAQRGFVAVTVEYANGSYPSMCSTMQARAKCIFDAASAYSAIAKVCARAKADCSKGIVSLGISQGSNIASLAKNYDGRARAAYLMANVLSPSILNLTSCLKDSATAFLPSQMRAISGESDEMMSGTSELRQNLNDTFGAYATCSTGTNCMKADGSGWQWVLNSNVADGKADHCFMINGGCSGPGTADPTYDTGSAWWSSSTSYDWLKARVTP